MLSFFPLLSQFRMDKNDFTAKSICFCSLILNFRILQSAIIFIFSSNVLYGYKLLTSLFIHMWCIHKFLAIKIIIIINLISFPHGESFGSVNWMMYSEQWWEFIIILMLQSQSAISEQHKASIWSIFSWIDFFLALCLSNCLLLSFSISNSLLSVTYSSRLYISWVLKYFEVHRILVPYYYSKTLCIFFIKRIGSFGSHTWKKHRLLDSNWNAEMRIKSLDEPFTIYGKSKNSNFPHTIKASSFFSSVSLILRTCSNKKVSSITSSSVPFRSTIPTSSLNEIIQ